MILIFITLLVEILLDAMEYQQHKTINHARGMFFRTLTAAAFFFTCDNWVQLILFMVGVYILLFDLAMGYIIKKNLFYIGNTSKWDRAVRRIPDQITLFLRVFLAAILTSFYFFPEQYGL